MPVSCMPVSSLQRLGLRFRILYFEINPTCFTCYRNKTTEITVRTCLPSLFACWLGAATSFTIASLFNAPLLAFGLIQGFLTPLLLSNDP